MQCRYLLNFDSKNSMAKFITIPVVNETERFNDVTINVEHIVELVDKNGSTELVISNGKIYKSVSPLEKILGVLQPGPDQ